VICNIVDLNNLQRLQRTLGSTFVTFALGNNSLLPEVGPETITSETFEHLEI